jgi:steroid 5-alpha reductase family enzyme
MALLILLAGTLALSVIMMGGWQLVRLWHNGGWVDVVWTFGLGAVGIVYALVPLPGQGAELGDWPQPRQCLVAVLVASWSLRLGLYLTERSRIGPEDARYAFFRTLWGAGFERRFFAFLQIQAAAAAILAVTFFLAAHQPRALGGADLIGLAIIAMGIIGEAIADAQLHRYRKSAPHGGICDVGLWSLSRHPNYFFEWLGWCAYPFFAIDLAGIYPWGWLSLSAPALMYWLLVHVSGIPFLEQQMLRTRGDRYRDYQARTRAFIPLPASRLK